MKQVKYILVFIFFLSITTIVNASSFNPRASLYEYDSDGIVHISLWYEGPAINEIENTFKYDATYFEIDDIDSDIFDVNSSIEEKDGKYRIVTIKAEADEDYESTTYAIVSLKMKKSFRIGDTSRFVLTDYYASSSEGKRYKNDGLILTINYHSRSDIYLVAQEKNAQTERTMWLDERIYLFLLIILVITIFIILFLLTPGNFITGNRSRRLKKRIKKDAKSTSVSKIKVDLDDISSIGEKPKEEPKNKLELGDFNPLKDNKSKPKQHIAAERDFKEAKVDIFNNKKKK